MEYIKLNGSIELGPIVGLSESLVDIVETGTTLKENGLEEFDSFMNLSARLVCNKVAYKMKQKEIQNFITSCKFE